MRPVHFVFAMLVGVGTSPAFASGALSYPERARTTSEVSCGGVQARLVFDELLVAEPIGGVRERRVALVDARRRRSAFHDANYGVAVSRFAAMAWVLAVSPSCEGSTAIFEIRYVSRAAYRIFLDTPLAVQQPMPPEARILVSIGSGGIRTDLLDP